MKHLLRKYWRHTLIGLTLVALPLPLLAAPVVSGAYFTLAGSGQYALAVTTNTTLTVPSNAAGAEICVETAGVRYTADGTSASSSVGMPVASGVCFQYFGPLSKLKFTAQSGSPTLDVDYYKISN
jgi:hypothetical protein